jgi:hypothetical protein
VTKGEDLMRHLSGTPISISHLRQRIPNRFNKIGQSGQSALSALHGRLEVPAMRP